MNAIDEACQGGLISHVDPEGIGAEIGIEPGDRLIAISGHCLRDIIDYRFYGAEENLELIVEQCGQRQAVEVERDYDEELGLEFADPLFDGLRQCANQCPFCFVNQMPARSHRALRRTLYLRDDDYRLSFLLGNFVTLTNLDEGDWQRIADQHLSPLYVSIHATDLETRRSLLGNPSAPDILSQLRRLRAANIQVHGQIVIVPGLNDGEVLRRSIADLLCCWPSLETLALVPVGLTRFHKRGFEPLTRKQAAAVLDLADAARTAIRDLTSSTWLYPSDELYLLAGRDLPSTPFYDSDAQQENGVGLVRELLDDWVGLRDRLPTDSGWPQRISMACGALVAPILNQIGSELADRTGIAVQVMPITNRFFGETVTVSGLLTGEDLMAQIHGRALGERLFLPRAMFEASGQLTLDDMTRSEIAAQLGVPISLASCMSDVLEGLDSHGSQVTD